LPPCRSIAFAQSSAPVRSHQSIWRNQQTENCFWGLACPLSVVLALQCPTGLTIMTARRREGVTGTCALVLNINARVTLPPLQADAHPSSEVGPGPGPGHALLLATVLFLWTLETEICG
jgi:hypothetical protein